MNTLRRIGLWFGSVLLSVTLVSQLLALLFHWGGPFSGPFFDIFRVAGMMAFPVACLYLPFVIALQDAEERRVWTILFSGILIGPASLLLWCIIAQLWSSDPNLWEGDPLTGIGCLSGMVLALVVGFLSTSAYVIALKVLHRWHAAAKGKFTRP
jgi:hypothetical protein